ncbi:MAG: hypothetical protein ACLVJ6_00530 [Merdibacter sp.]
MRSVPNISYIVLILYWFSRNISSVIISFLILFPMIYQTLLEALKSSADRIRNCCTFIPSGSGKP